MDLRAMGAHLSERAELGVFRWEGLRYYDAASDQGDYERFLRGEAPAGDRSGFIQMLRTAAEQNHPWRRLRVVHVDDEGTIPPYEHYSCTLYSENAAAGEDVRVLEVSADNRLDTQVPDFWVVQRDHVVVTHYDDAGRHIGAEVATPEYGSALLALRDVSWAQAVPFEDWWAEHPDLHRARAQVA
ncbi:DUF6879 family protein [Pseudonocardia sp. RS010]|uniref:DUF6879 family protein n=1 Tax=Pseudonocardia sp. RS010 TaxID=3385979 RepID=UPI0039A2B441